MPTPPSVQTVSPASPLSIRLSDLAQERRWCRWVNDRTRGKVPYGVDGHASVAHPDTWITLAEAQSLPRDGVGIFLGDLGERWNGAFLVGIDYDSCFDANGLAGWAAMGLELIGGYSEVSPSGGGIKQWALVTADEIGAVRAALGRQGRQFKQKREKGAGGHPPAIEVYTAARMFTVTGKLGEGEEALSWLDGARMARFMAGPVVTLLGRAAKVQGEEPSVPALRAVDGAGGIGERLQALLALRPRLRAVVAGDGIAAGLSDQSGSGFGFAAMGELRDAGWTFEDAVQALFSCGETVEDWATRADERQLQRAWKHVVEYGRVPSAGFMAVPLPAVAVQGINGHAVLNGHGRSDWKDLLQIGRDKDWRGNLNNARIALLEAPELKGILALDEFADQVIIKRPWPFEKRGRNGERNLEGADHIRLAAWLQAEGLQVTPTVVFDAIASVAIDFGFDPVQEYLEQVGRNWDGRERLDTWLWDYFGVVETPYSRAVAAKSLIGAVARAMEPGCKMDTITILEGKQGIYKSTALRILFGSGRFIDHMPDLTHSRDAAMQLAGNWCVEHAEMDKLRGAEVSRVKAWLSTPIDMYRAPYEKAPGKHPRRSVNWATTNAVGEEYLPDSSGNRRAWPVECSGEKVNIKRLEAERDQIWGEATHRYLQDEDWWLSPELEPAQAEEAAKRFVEDPWASDIRKIANSVKPAANGEYQVTISQILHGGVGITKDRWNLEVKRRISRVLQADGWIGKHVRIGKIRQYTYCRVTNPDEE